MLFALHHSYAWTFAPQIRPVSLSAVLMLFS
jgi:hypothetical protein